jgi:hypothetical protein
MSEHGINPRFVLEATRDTVNSLARATAARFATTSHPHRLSVAPHIASATRWGAFSGGFDSSFGVAA